MNQSRIIVRLIRYFFVGLAATVVEWIGFGLLHSQAGAHYMLATAIAFFFSTFANWAFGRMILFKGSGNIWQEILKIYMVSILGLAMNLGLMYLMVDVACMDEMPAKMLATAIVFAWNFVIRQFFIYGDGQP